MTNILYMYEEVVILYQLLHQLSILGLQYLLSPAEDAILSPQIAQLGTLHLVHGALATQLVDVTFEFLPTQHLLSRKLLQLILFFLKDGSQDESLACHNHKGDWFKIHLSTVCHL